jgi:hypothetical protein
VPKSKALRPTKPEQVLTASLLGRELLVELPQAARKFLHGSPYYRLGQPESSKYPPYVIHLLVLDQGLWFSHSIRLDLLHLPGAAATAVIMAAANVVVYWIARASWKYYEKPILRLKDRLAPVSPELDHNRAPLLAG